MSLLSEIFELIEYERLIEEGKDPVELLHYKFQYIPNDVIDAVIEIDPTKKKSYSQWLLSKWNEESDTIVNNLKNGRIAKLFDHYKSHQDIQIKDCPSVEEGLRQFVPEEETVLTKSSKPTTILMNRGWTEEVPSELANDFDIVFNDDDWIIAVPNTYEADCKLGENMNWCTAGGRSDFKGGRYYYDHYLNDNGGKYYVNFDMSKGESRLGKDYPFTRYQFHFETKQFMDLNDDPVDLSEIGMPDSALEFYSDEGYDTDDFENLEARMERYEEQRYQNAYRINNELELNIAYDEDFQIGQIDDNTDFYLFSADDDRDPICWDEIPNPHTNEGVVIFNSDSLCIFKNKFGKSDNGVIIAYNVSNNGWGRWETTNFNEYMLLPDNIGVFGLNDNNHYSFISSDGESEISFNNLSVKDSDNIFINNICTNVDAEENEGLFIETVSNGYHSLFVIYSSNNDCDMIIKKDIPANGKYFEIDENGLINGEFRSYNVYGSNDNLPNWDLEEKLATGDYLITSYKESEYYNDTKVVYNILKPNSNEPLIKDWFDKLYGTTLNLYAVKKDKKVGFFNNKNGEQIGRWYDLIGGLDKENDIVYGRIGEINMPSLVDVIDGGNSKVIGTFNDIVSRCAANNKIIVLNSDGFTTKVFDYTEGKFYFPELGFFRRVNQYDYPFIFACKIQNTEEQALFDLKSLNIVVRGIKSFERLSSYERSFIKIIKMNDKSNIFDLKQSSEILPYDVEAITSINSTLGIIIYEDKGKAYPYDYINNRVVINPNGFPIATSVTDGDKIRCSGKNYDIYFAPEGSGNRNFVFYAWRSQLNLREYGYNLDPQTTPQEVLNMYNIISGQQNNVSEEFKKMVKRMNEAVKLFRIDILD